MKHLNIAIDDEMYEELQAVKGDRTWYEALRDEFGLTE
jgi:predicted CopG family antitoxin